MRKMKKCDLEEERKPKSKCKSLAWPREGKNDQKYDLVKAIAYL